MKQIFDEIKTVPGVIGVFALHAKKGVLQSAVPTVFKADKLLEVSRQLLKIYSVTRMNLGAMQDIHLHFDGSVLVLRQISDLMFLVVICDPQVNIHMLGMSLSLAADEMASNLSAAEPVKPQQAEPAPKTLEELRGSGPLAAPLQKIEAALAQLMGPVAEMILDEAFEEWSQSGKMSFESLPKLVRILSRELGDPQKVKDFLKIIAPYGQAG